MNLFSKDNHFVAGFGPSQLAYRTNDQSWNLLMGMASRKPLSFINEFNRALAEISEVYSHPTYLLTGQKFDSFIVNAILTQKLNFEFLSYDTSVGRRWQHILPGIRLLPLDWDVFLKTDFAAITEKSAQTCPVAGLVLLLALEAKKIGLHPIVHHAELDAQFDNFSWKIDFGEIQMSPLTWFKSENISGVPQLFCWSPELMASLLSEPECLRLFANSIPTSGSLLETLSKKFFNESFALPEPERLSSEFLLTIENVKAKLLIKQRSVYELKLDVNEISDYLTKDIHDQTH